MAVRIVLCLIVIALSLGVAIAARAATPLHTVRVAQGLSFPLFATSPPSDTARVFIVERRGPDSRGRVKILRNGSILARPFLTTQVLSTGSEQGLLGLAFAPDYATTGRFYINYTRSDGTTIIERRLVSADPDSAEPTGVTVLSIPQPQANHNGGWLGFGPDGYLYVASGDGGGAGDTDDNAQNLSTHLGKILRLDVSGATYRSPASNPFFGSVPGLDEIWAYGLRNPWRPSFDRLTGDLIIADVGQETLEEINFAPAGSPGGENYGWRPKEGSAPTPGVGDPIPPGVVDPIHEYSHAQGRSVIGGYVYRGSQVAGLGGTYVFADHFTRIWSFKYDGTTVSGFTDRTAELGRASGSRVSSFGEDAAGELYIVYLGGSVFRVTGAIP